VPPSRDRRRGALRTLPLRLVLLWAGRRRASITISRSGWIKFLLAAAALAASLLVASWLLPPDDEPDAAMASNILWP
jgi:hypothetical protein